MNKKILIVDDEKEIVDLLEVYLSNDGYSVYKCYNGLEAMKCIKQSQIDLAILDIMLPDIDGFRLCQKIREKFYFPIIMLTAKGETSDKINGLEMGADDYVTKPFEVKELLARVHAVMRRTDADAPVEKKLVFDRLVINLDSYELIVDGKKVDTPPKEMELLYHLASSPNRCLLYTSPSPRDA